jgi:hypothetical protein
MPTYPQKRSPKKAPKKSPPRKKSPARKSPPRQRVGQFSPKVRQNRQGPLKHASYFKVGDKEMGEDGHMWVIRNVTKSDGTRYKRWFRI